MLRTHDFGLKGSARKPLLEAIEGYTRVKPIYKGAPTMSYAVYGLGTLDKDGKFSFDCDLQEIMDCVTYLERNGFACVGEEAVTEEQTAGVTEVETGEEQPQAKRRGILDILEGEINANLPEGERTCRLHSEPTIIDGHGRQHSLDGRFAVAPTYGDVTESTETEDVPIDEREELGLGRTRRENFAGENGMRSDDVPTTISIEFPDTNVKPDILTTLLNSKASLIETALGGDCAWEHEYGVDGLPLCDLPIEFKDGKVAFEWLKFGADGDSVKAWSAFLAAAVKFSKTAKRVTAKDEGVPENAKFAFRTFLVKLKMNDADNKAHRKHLLRNLKGDSAFATPESKAKWQRKHLKGSVVAETEGSSND